MKIAHVAEDKNPVVLGRLGREPGLPTIAFYGHYDVQVRPFEARVTVRKGLGKG